MGAATVAGRLQEQLATWRIAHRRCESLNVAQTLENAVHVASVTQIPDAGQSDSFSLDVGFVGLQNDEDIVSFVSILCARVLLDGQDIDYIPLIYWSRHHHLFV